MPFVSAFDSLEYESSKHLHKYRKDLKKINTLTDHYRNLPNDTLRFEAQSLIEDFSLKNRKVVLRLMAIAREVTYRLLGKFQYDVQILGALAALDRNAVQMSTGSGKTITLILPAVIFGLTRKGVNILTVNDYLSERDWEETHPVYDWFGLTNAYTNNDQSNAEQRAAYDCDITYSTNSSLGFAYLRSALASDINQDMKVIARPLHAAIIDEVDEILMDDARNPLIIANNKDIREELSTATIGDREVPVEWVLRRLRHLTKIGYEAFEAGSTPFINDEAMDEILELLDIQDSRLVFDNPKLIHVIYSSVTVLFSHKRYEDYMVMPEPDPDTGSRIALIDKATGRLSHGRTLSDNLHAFLEMKEGVFTGSASESSIQVTYQILFNLFHTISGVSGTLGTSFKEFKDIYSMGVVVIPDRLPNKLRQMSHLYVTQEHLFEDLVTKTKLYMASRHPVLIGARTDNEAMVISQYIEKAGIPHHLLVSTDKDEEAIVAKAGLPGSVVVTTDIMGRGTDIHVEDVEMERGLAVLQVGSRPNSRVERQFAGRAARQGQPGRYHRMLTLPELPDIGVVESERKSILRCFQEDIDTIERFNGDILMNGQSHYYYDILKIIDNALAHTESSFSQSRVDDFSNFSITDVIQSSVLHDLDKYRAIIKRAYEEAGSEALQELRLEAAKLLLPSHDRMNRKKVQEALTEVSQIPADELQIQMFDYCQHIAGPFLRALREYSDQSIGTVRMSTTVKYDTRPEILMTTLMSKFLASHEDDYFRFRLKTPASS